MLLVYTSGSCVSLFPARSKVTSCRRGGVSLGRVVMCEEWRERVCRWKQWGREGRECRALPERLRYSSCFSCRNVLVSE